MLNKVIYFPYCGDQDIYMFVKHIEYDVEGTVLTRPYFRFDSEDGLYISAIDDTIVISDDDIIQIQEYSTLKELALDFINRNLK